MEVQPLNPTSPGPQDWFTGEVWIDPITSGHGSEPVSLGHVHFSPGARTAWHAHSVGQTLHVTAGVGRVQSRGEAVRTIRPGDIVNFSADEWHWHGATPDHLMTHLSFTRGHTQWGDHVSDHDYRQTSS